MRTEAQEVLRQKIMDIRNEIMRHPEYFKYEIKRIYPQDVSMLGTVDMEISFYNDIDVRGLSVARRFSGDETRNEYDMIYELWFSAYEYYLKNEKDVI